MTRQAPAGPPPRRLLQKVKKAVLAKLTAPAEEQEAIPLRAVDEALSTASRHKSLGLMAEHAGDPTLDNLAYRRVLRSIVATAQGPEREYYLGLAARARRKVNR